jgi:hypothetical protein
MISEKKIKAFFAGNDKAISEAEFVALSNIVGYKVPKDRLSVYWFLESSGNVELKWLPKEEIGKYLCDFEFIGFSVSGKIPHFRKVN